MFRSSLYYCNFFFIFCTPYCTMVGRVHAVSSLGLKTSKMPCAFPCGTNGWLQRCIREESRIVLRWSPIHILTAVFLFSAINSFGLWKIHRYWKNGWVTTVLFPPPQLLCWGLNKGVKDWCSLAMSGRGRHEQGVGETALLAIHFPWNQEGLC